MICNIDNAQWPCSAQARPATSSHFTRQLCPAPSFVSVSCFRDIIITTDTTTKQHNKTFIPELPPRPAHWTHTGRNCFGAFHASLRAHRARKGHRLFAPVALPSPVNIRGIFELLRTYTHHRGTLTSLSKVSCDATLLSPPRAPPRPNSTAHRDHNNGVDTTSKIAARAYSSHTSARSSARRLRALLSAPLQAHHNSEQPLRLFSLRPPI